MAKSKTNNQPSDSLGMDDIAGYADEKREIFKIIRILKEYDKYSKKGIYVPRGLLLQGPPGCGKTLFTKAISHDCGVAFHSFDVAMESNPSNAITTLGRLFDEARKTKPSIVYIDEIDSLVTNKKFSSDESRSCLQFLLTTLDGISSSDGIMVVATTNNYSELPIPLVRSGRIDRKIKIDFPDNVSREAIIRLYTKGHSIFDKLDVKNLAVRLKGMSGSDIKTLINNALIEYVDDKEYIQSDDFVKLINDMDFETIGKRWKGRETAARVLAHEVGHSLVGWVLKGDHGSISAIRYDEMAGHTSFGLDDLLDLDDDGIKLDDGNRESLLDDICVSLGGMAGDIVYDGRVNAGNSGDLTSATATASAMLDCAMFGFRNAKVVEDYQTSQTFKARRERKIQSILDAQLKRAVSIVKRLKALGMFIVKTALDEGDTLTSAQVEKAIRTFASDRKALAKEYGKLKLTDLTKGK